MKFIKSKNTDGQEVNLYYEDLGQGKPVILIHGWPLDHQMWENQFQALVEGGYRVIAYDRRGFGKSDKPWTAYDYSTLADDLKAVIDQLQLEDVALIGFSMAGGEVVRYFSRHGGAKVRKAVLVSSIAPYMLQTEDNPDGVPQETIQAIGEGLEKDRAAFLDDFGKQFFGVNLLNHPVSNQMLEWNLHVAMQASLRATTECATSFATTDLRSEMSSISVPLLVIHGDADQTVPIKATGEQAAQLVPHAQYIIYEGQPHGLFYTAKEQLNVDLLEFLSK
ncbi:alpha/beta hydrolase [Mucilaginibacter sp. 21P]|uniref:alpha/beta fold hydrolase n=1 Tax=Mucilaginibacter sp. 21P TaxID=2778902 RepID=UPI001C577471|nr:alpha/beta hydrolase [Mucilaginibacter sp. 21P]QXV65978.1 alpha/beta hydrolase [Mucilaginibacter sp. 21P]